MQVHAVSAQKEQARAGPVSVAGLSNERTVVATTDIYEAVHDMQTSALEGWRSGVFYFGAAQAHTTVRQIEVWTTSLALRIPVLFPYCEETHAMGWRSGSSILAPPRRTWMPTRSAPRGSPSCRRYGAASASRYGDGRLRYSARPTSKTELVSDFTDFPSNPA